MNVPCKIKSRKYVMYGGFEMSSNSYAYVTVETGKSNSRYRMLRVTCNNSHTIFTEAALENAIKRGDFSLA